MTSDPDASKQLAVRNSRCYCCRYLKDLFFLLSDQRKVIALLPFSNQYFSTFLLSLCLPSPLLCAFSFAASTCASSYSCDNNANKSFIAIQHVNGCTYFKTQTHWRQFVLQFRRAQFECIEVHREFHIFKYFSINGLFLLVIKPDKLNG